MHRLIILGCVALAGLAGCTMESESNSDTSLASSTNALTGWQYISHIVPGGSNGYLDVQGAGTENGTTVWTWSFNGSSAQLWNHSPENGPLMNANGKCLDVRGGGTANGTPVWLWECNGTGAQQWVHAGAGVYYNPQSNKCLDVPNNNPAAGIPLQIWDCNGSDAQRWASQAM